MGKPKYIETPEKLYDLFQEFKDEVKSNPRERKITGNNGFIVSQEKLERPLTYSGFNVFCSKKGFSIKHYFENRNDSYTDYVPICLIIKDEIRTDQIEGGMVGQYNASITQRLNGLKEQTDVTTDGEKITAPAIDVSKLPTDVLQALIKAKKDE